MSHAISKGLALAIAAAPLFIACGGGTASAPSAISTSQCSGSSCGVQGPPAEGATASLCPATADIVNSTYLGGGGSGEIASVHIDAVAMTYTLKWYESPIPLAAGTVTPTRAGTTITGSVMHPPVGTLPTAEQTRCAFILLPGSGTAAATGGTYSTTSTFNSANPPMILIGQGVAGGGIPGAEVQYPGLAGLFAVPDRQFDFYPFIGFAQIDTNLADLQGTYNALLYHIQPSDTWAQAGTNAIETYDASGNCSSTSGGCKTTGGAWTASGSGSYFTSSAPPKIVSGPSLGPTAQAHMVIGQLNGAIVPVVVRTGNANPGQLAVDDESGIALLAADQPLASGGFDGAYAGADSNFKYTATLIQGGLGSFVNPSTSAQESGFALQYGLSSPGLVGVTDQQGNTGYAIASGGLYAILIQGEENGGITASSGIVGQTTSSVPYFGIGALVSK
jgi:hypothetical protein